MNEYSTACPRNCYSSCAFKVKVIDNKITEINAHPGNKATFNGPCLKGLSYVERASAEKRIITPLIKKNNSFEKISWNEVLQIISNRLQYFKNNFGPQSVLYYTASGMSGLLNGNNKNFWRMYGGATTVYGNLCWPAGLEAVRLTMGKCNHNAPWDLKNSKLILLWGKNSAETNIHEMNFIFDAIENKSTFIVIDPRRTPSAERANFLFQIKPGTDAFLALTICNILIEKNLTDHEFIENHVSGYDEFCRNVKKYTTDKAEEICGIPANEIEKLAELIGNTKPMTLIPGYGMQRYTNGGQTIRALLAISVITGNIGKPGASFNYANLQSYIFDETKEPLSYFPQINAEEIFRRSIHTANLGNDMLAQINPELKMIWVERGNPVTQNPDTNKTLEAFAKLEFRVVIEEFMTDTAQQADIILPAKNMFEQSDIIGSYWHPYVQLRQKVTEPPPLVKTETEIYYLLAKEMGFDEELIKKYLIHPAETDDYLKNLLKKYPEITWKKLQETPCLADNFEEIAYADKKFDTPSGKIELLSTQAKELWGITELAEYVEIQKPESSEKKYSLQLLTPNSKNRIHSQFGNLDIIRNFEKEPALFVNPTDAKQRNISNNAIVKIFNKKGELKIKVQFDYGILAGCVAMYNGWWISQGGTSNFLSAGLKTDIGYGAAFHDCFVEIENI